VTDEQDGERMNPHAIAEGGPVTARARPTRDVEFESWLVAREPALQRTAHLLTGDVHTAQDLVQTTLAKLYLAWDRIQGPGSVDAYARRILVNEHRSAWRRPVRRRELVTGEVPDRVAPDRGYDGTREAVWAFVGTLPPKQRAVVVLRFYEQLTEAEIADLMGISVGTVKSQSSRALASLRTHLHDHPELGLDNRNEEER
jgi:RNA polymerase sigma-70 factor (sigma-E family)